MTTCFVQLLQAKTTAMLLERRRQAEAREARIAIEKARERAILYEACDCLRSPARACACVLVGPGA